MLHSLSIIVGYLIIAFIVRTISLIFEDTSNVYGYSRIVEEANVIGALWIIVIPIWILSLIATLFAYLWTKSSDYFVEKIRSKLRGLK
jgi:hypothetical protein